MDKPKRTIACLGCTHCMNLEDVVNLNFPIKCEVGMETMLLEDEVLAGCAFGETTIERIRKSGMTAKEYFKDFDADIIRANVHAVCKTEKE